jgi:hypothetical protein
MMIQVDLKLTWKEERKANWPHCEHALLIVMGRGFAVLFFLSNVLSGLKRVVIGVPFLFCRGQQTTLQYSVQLFSCNINSYWGASWPTSKSRSVLKCPETQHTPSSQKPEDTCWDLQNLFNKTCYAVLLPPGYCCALQMRYYLRFMVCKAPILICRSFKETTHRPLRTEDNELWWLSWPHYLHDRYS